VEALLAWKQFFNLPISAARRLMLLVPPRRVVLLEQDQMVAQVCRAATAHLAVRLCRSIRRMEAEVGLAVQLLEPPLVAAELDWQGLVEQQRLRRALPELTAGL
jgi:hypothetical protein